jgi:hypothetical protein
MRKMRSVVKSDDLVKATRLDREEVLPTGESVSKAMIVMGKGCCGAAYVEKAGQAA